MKGIYGRAFLLMALILISFSVAAQLDVGVDAEAIDFDSLPEYQSKSEDDERHGNNAKDILAWFVAGILMMAVILIWKVFLKPFIKKIKGQLQILTADTMIRGVSAGLAILMLLFPPWTESINGLTRPLEYAFLFIPPEALYHRNASVAVDYGRLLIQFVLLGSLTWFGMKICQHKNP